MSTNIMLWKKIEIFYLMNFLAYMHFVEATKVSLSFFELANKPCEFNNYKLQIETINVLCYIRVLLNFSPACQS